MKLLHKYRNGNVDVEIYDDGTKIREWPDHEAPKVDYPESCDLKITQYCDLDSVCVYCHEMSNKQGQHGNLDIVDKIWSTQLPGTELAIGGGNPLAHPQLESFLRKMTGRGIIPNVTVNTLHMNKFAETIKRFQADKLIYGLGVSYRGIASMKKLPDIDYSNTVFHMILGVHTIEDCNAVIDWCRERSVHPKLLLLGYKTFGKGEAHYSEELQSVIDEWKSTHLAALLNQNNITVSFDNLAIKQLDVRGKLTEDEWNELYMGDDGTHTLYCDAIAQTFARTSTSTKRYPINSSTSVRDMINIIHAERSEENSK